MKETIGLHHRGGEDSLDAREAKLTPTPRRSIHSFKVSQTEGGDSKRTVGVERSETKGRAVPSESRGGWVRTLIKCLLAVLAILAAVYLAWTYKNDEANSFDQIIDAVNTAQAEAPPTANIGDL